MDNLEFVEAQQMDLLMSRGISANDAELVIRSLSPSTVHVDRPLSNLAVAFRNREYIADRAMPVVKVNDPSDKYFKWDGDTYFDEQSALLTGSEGMPGRVRYKLSTDNYSCQDYGLMDFVGRKEEISADAPIQPRISATKIVTNRLLLAKERRVANVVFNAANYGANTTALAGATQWDNAGSDPVQAILDAIEACDMRPNALVLGAQVWQKLQNHAKMTALVYNRAATSSGPVPLRPTLATVAAAFELDMVLIGRAKVASQKEGQASARGYVWGKSAALIRITETPDIRETDTFGYQFEHLPFETQVIDAPLPGVRGGVYVKVTQSIAEKVVGGGASGFLYTAAVA